MAQYRIVKKKHFDHAHVVQRKFLGFWFTVVGSVLYWSLEDCERYIQGEKERQERVKRNPRDLVVKTY